MGIPWPWVHDNVELRVELDSAGETGLRKKAIDGIAE